MLHTLLPPVLIAKKRQSIPCEHIVSRNGWQLNYFIMWCSSVWLEHPSDTRVVESSSLSTTTIQGCGLKVSRLIWGQDIKWVRFPPSLPDNIAGWSSGSSSGSYPEGRGFKSHPRYFFILMKFSKWKCSHQGCTKCLRSSTVRAFRKKPVAQATDTARFTFLILSSKQEIPVRVRTKAYGPVTQRQRVCFASRKLRVRISSGPHIMARWSELAYANGSNPFPLWVRIPPALHFIQENSLTEKRRPPKLQDQGSNPCSPARITHVRIAELAYASDLKSDASNGLWVRLPFRTLICSVGQTVKPPPFQGED